MTPRLFIHRTLRSLGWHVQRWRDPFTDAASLLQGRQINNLIDGGAYHGGTVARMAALFPNATIHAFEPQPDSFAHLQRKFAGNPRVRLNQCALSDRDGRATLHVNRQAFTTSLLPSMETAVMESIGTQDVATTTLDTWASEQGVGSVGLLKLDLQGHELAALRGAERLLDDVSLIHIEVNFQPRYEGTCLFHEIAAFLGERGFRVHRMYEFIDGPDSAWQQADALFASNSLLEGRLPNSPGPGR